MKKKGFTLIELIAILVILAILALIVTPLVMNIIKKARISADKRSIDAYGRSVEYAISSYVLDNFKYPKSIEELKIDYKGEEVICSIEKINPNSTIYLSDCTVGGRSVDYSYGKNILYKEYKIGDLVTYNNIDYYVIKNSDETEEFVTMLKAEPLTVAEVNTYGVGHINRYTSESIGTAYDQNGYGGMAYYTSETCGFPNGSYTYAGCITDYSQSEIKYVVDAWASDKASDAIEYRLIKIDELIANLGCTSTACDIVKYSWLYSNRYWYWTMSPKEQATALILFIGSGGVYTTNGADYGCGSVRPVITISKTLIKN